MNILENRIQSFQKTPNPWPHNDSKYNVEAFAKAGFYHVRRPRITDSVRCFLCDLELSHWTKTRSPYLRHIKESSQCPWVLLNFPDGHDLTDRSGEALDNPTMQKVRLLTFQHHNYWPPHKGRQNRTRKYPAASKVAEAGFFLSPTLTEAARIKCPSCQVTISEPEKEPDLLQRHQALNSQCPFIQQKIHSKIKRDTINSLHSSESFKTASSQLHNEEESQKKRKHMEAANQSRSNKQKTTTEGSIWDIEGTFHATPPHVKKPAITFGKHRGDKKRSRILPSSKQGSTVDIFAEALGPDSTVIKHQQEAKKDSQIVSEGSQSEAPQRAIHQAEATVKQPSTQTQEILDPVIHKPVEATVTIESYKRDKGKGRAVESLASIAAAMKRDSLPNPSRDIPHNRPSLQSKKPISLSKSKRNTFSPPPLPSVTTSSSISLSHSLPKPDEPEEMIYFDQPLLSPRQSNQPNYFQSTPANHDRNNQVSAADIFGDCSFSPIVANSATHSDALTPSLGTPRLGSGRIRPSVTESDHKRWRALSPPTSPTLRSSKMADPPILSQGDVLPQLPPTGISSKQKAMTVERFLQDTIEANIHKVKEHGAHMIEMIKQKSNQVKSELLQQRSSSE